MLPTTIMAANNSYDPFSQFHQLSLDSGNPLAAPAPETPPQASKSEMMNAPVVNAGCQNPNQQQTHPPQQQQQQPMPISPEQPPNPGALAQQQPLPPQPPNAYPNHQYNPFGPPSQMQHQQNQKTMHSSLLASPPISPLWSQSNHPCSPGQTPPDAVHNVSNGAVPSLPNSFGNASAAAGGARVPTLSPGSPAAAQADPFDAFGNSKPTSAAQAAPSTDPFGVHPFGANAAPATAQQQVQGQEQDNADFWNDMGFGMQPAKGNSNKDDNSPGNVTPTGSDASLSSVTSDTSDTFNLASDAAPVALDERGMPAGGEYYRARVTTPMLGAIFSSGKEVRSTLYKAASDSFVDAIGDRPVISFTIDGSAADTAGIGLGHVLLKVNEAEVLQTDEAVRAVGTASRPMIMEFYALNKEVKVTKTEGQCMVKYDNHSTEAPASACEWKPKYVVVGDMLGKPHILYMYRSKAEYDIAVKESQTRNRALSVKVKQFDIRGAKIFHERGTVHYPNKPIWHYFTVVRGTGLPIKISCRSQEELRPVYEGVVAFLDEEAGAKRARPEMGKERMHVAGMYRETYY